MTEPGTDAPSVTHPTPIGERLLVTTEGLETKPVLYVPEGAQTRRGLFRAIVLKLGDELLVPYGAGDVVLAAHEGLHIGGDLYLLEAGCVLAWEGA